MDNWFLNEGYPVVIINRIELTNLTLIVLKQKRFLFDSERNIDSLWQIPISLKTNQQKILNIYWLNETESKLNLNLV